MGKEEIAHYEQFLLFPQCFQKACFPGASKGVIVWERPVVSIFRTGNFCLLPLMHARKVISSLGKICVSTGMRKPGNT